MFMREHARRDTTPQQVSLLLLGQRSKTLAPRSLPDRENLRRYYSGCSRPPAAAEATQAIITCCTASAASGQ